MIELIQEIQAKVEEGFVKAGYQKEAGRVTISNRPDLCEYQCNGAMAIAKKLKKNPLEIAGTVADILSSESFFEKVSAVQPGFININISPKALLDYLDRMLNDDSLSLPDNEGHYFLDYGGPNVAKPLHVGHLRSAIIGESLKSILKALGYKVTGDIHLGDWGQQMGLIIAELRERQPDLCYFDEDYIGEYPNESPFTLSQLEEIYPFASAKAKENEEFKALAMEATNKLQKGDKAYNAILKHILNLSIADLKKNYERLRVSFDLWKGESDAAPYINDMVEDIKSKGFAVESEGALVVPVALESDKKEVPPCMILKSDGAALYNTTDLATLVWRINDYNPDKLVYIVDKRQDLYFTQVFRCSKKVGIVPEDRELTFLGFGTMNGTDGKPFKTREGGVMRLSVLLDEVKEACLAKISGNDSIPEESREDIAEKIAIAAIKYGDLSNAPSKDYIFDISKFISFEGNTGPYILYTIVRANSILKKYVSQGGDVSECRLLAPKDQITRNLMIILSRFNTAVISAGSELAPNKICGYIYELSNAFNSFYHETRILSCEDEEEKQGYIKLLDLTYEVLVKSIDMLGFSAPERM